MARKSNKCALCGIVTGNQYYDMTLCENCESTADWFAGSPLFPATPQRCPVCRCKELDTNRAGEESAFDETLAIECGVDLDAVDELGYPLRYSDKEHYDRFLYDYAFAVCQNPECGQWTPYGNRAYWNEESGCFDAPKPLTPREQVAEANRKQEAAGQIRMFA